MGTTQNNPCISYRAVADASLKTESGYAFGTYAFLIEEAIEVGSAYPAVKLISVIGQITSKVRGSVEAEMFAIRLVLAFCRDRGIPNKVVFNDNKAAVSRLQDYALKEYGVELKWQKCNRNSRLQRKADKLTKLAQKKRRKGTLEQPIEKVQEWGAVGPEGYPYLDEHGLYNKTEGLIYELDPDGLYRCRPVEKRKRKRKLAIRTESQIDGDLFRKHTPNSLGLLIARQVLRGEPSILSPDIDLQNLEPFHKAILEVAAAKLSNVHLASSDTKQSLSKRQTVIVHDAALFSYLTQHKRSEEAAGTTVQEICGWQNLNRPVNWAFVPTVRYVRGKDKSVKEAVYAFLHLHRLDDQARRALNTLFKCKPSAHTICSEAVEAVLTKVADLTAKKAKCSLRKAAELGLIRKVKGGWEIGSPVRITRDLLKTLAVKEGTDLDASQRNIDFQRSIYGMDAEVRQTFYKNNLTGDLTPFPRTFSDVSRATASALALVVSGSKVKRPKENSEQMLIGIERMAEITSLSKDGVAGALRPYTHAIQQEVSCGAMPIASYNELRAKFGGKFQPVRKVGKSAVEVIEIVANRYEPRMEKVPGYAGEVSTFQILDRQIHRHSYRATRRKHSQRIVGEKNKYRLRDTAPENMKHEERTREIRPKNRREFSQQKISSTELSSSIKNRLNCNATYGKVRNRTKVPGKVGRHKSKIRIPVSQAEFAKSINHYQYPVALSGRFQPRYEHYKCWCTRSGSNSIHEYIGAQEASQRDFVFKLERLQRAQEKMRTRKEAKWAEYAAADQSCDREQFNYSYDALELLISETSSRIRFGKGNGVSIGGGLKSGGGGYR